MNEQNIGDVMTLTMEKLRDLGLSETAMQKILSGNLLKILGENA